MVTIVGCCWVVCTCTGPESGVLVDLTTVGGPGTLVAAGFGPLRCWGMIDADCCCIIVGTVGVFGKRTRMPEFVMKGIGEIVAEVCALCIPVGVAFDPP